MLERFCSNCHTNEDFCKGCKECPIGNFIYAAKDYLQGTTNKSYASMKKLFSQIEPAPWWIGLNQKRTDNKMLIGKIKRSLKRKPLTSEW